MPTVDVFDPATGQFRAQQVQPLYVPTPGPSVARAGETWTRTKLGAHGVADISLAALLDLLIDLPDDATVGDMRNELKRRAASAQLQEQG